MHEQASRIDWIIIFRRSLLHAKSLVLLTRGANIHTKRVQIYGSNTNQAFSGSFQLEWRMTMEFNGAHFAAIQMRNIKFGEMLTNSFVMC